MVISKEDIKFVHIGDIRPGKIFWYVSVHAEQASNPHKVIVTGFPTTKGNPDVLKNAKYFNCIDVHTDMDWEHNTRHFLADCNIEDPNGDRGRYNLHRMTTNLESARLYQDYINTGAYKNDKEDSRLMDRMKRSRLEDVDDRLTYFDWDM